MMTKQQEIERLERELAAAVDARTELKEQLEVQYAREANIRRHLDDLRGTVELPGRGLTGRIIQLVEEVGEVGPTRCAELLAMDDPSVKAGSVRTLMGQLAKEGRLSKPRRGIYAPA